MHKKRHLRKEIKWILITLIVTQTIAQSLSLYNDYLKKEVIYLTLIVQNEEMEFIDYLEPCSTSSAKSYMDYKTITSKTSEQWKYIEEFMKVEDGFLKDSEGNYGVALGSYFGPIGTKYLFVLDTGIEIPVVKIEHKDDKHVFDGCVHKIDGSVIEFVIDSLYFEKESNGYIYQGNFNNNPLFSGSIKKIIKK